MHTVEVPFESPDLDGDVLLGSEGSSTKRNECMMLQEIKRRALQQTDSYQIGDIVKETFWPKIMIVRQAVTSEFNTNIMNMTVH